MLYITTKSHLPNLIKSDQKWVILQLNLPKKTNINNVTKPSTSLNSFTKAHFDSRKIQLSSSWYKSGMPKKAILTFYPYCEECWNLEQSLNAGIEGEASTPFTIYTHICKHLIATSKAYKSSMIEWTNSESQVLLRMMNRDPW